MAVCYCSLPPREVFSVIEKGLLTGPFLSTELITSHVTRPQNDVETVLGVFEKYSWRNSNRMSLTVLCTPYGKGGSEVFFAASGAGKGMLGLFDWGAAEDFENAVRASIEPYRISESE